MLNCVCLFSHKYNSYNISSELPNSSIKYQSSATALIVHTNKHVHGECLSLTHCCDTMSPVCVRCVCVASVPVFSSVNSFNRCQFGHRCESVPVGFSGLFLCHYEDVCISKMCQHIHRCVTVVSVV